MSRAGDRGPDDFSSAWRDAAALFGGPSFAGRSAGGPSGPGLDELAAWYRTVAEELRDATLAAPTDAAVFQRKLESFAISFFTRGAVAGGPAATAPPWPGFAPFGVAGALPTSTSPGAVPNAAALGPWREHQQRGAALASALADFAAARQALVPLLADAARAAASAFASRLAGGAGGSARATFDLWIDCAESAWQDLAHGEAWCAAQARAFDAALSVVACQQDLAEHAARLAGVPGRREVDDLHRRLRALERERGA